MQKPKNTDVTLYCFSPAIMLWTFSIEFGLAIYTFIKSRKAHSNAGIVLGLVFLGTFQLAEYMICRGSNPLFWSRLGLFVISFLPIFGYYLVSRIKNDYKLVKVGFVAALGLAMFFAFYPAAVTDAACGGNYVILNIQPALYQFFGYYYFAFLLLGIWKAMAGIHEYPKKEKVKKALKWLIIGYLSFMLPATLIWAFIVPARIGISSVMCGFAIIFAFILTFKIAPIYHDCVKSRKHQKLLENIGIEK